MSFGMSHKVRKRFGANVRRLRVSGGMSQEALAERSRSHRNYIGGIERGERNPTLTKIVDLAAALHCDIDSLFTGIVAHQPRKGR